MSVPFYIIVGDDYRGFSDEDKTFVLSDFYEKMLKNQGWPEPNAKVVLGQGVSYHDREFLSHTLKKRGVENFYPLPDVAPLEVTHKRSQENVLISKPEKFSQYRYRFDLSITDKVDRLSDHVTGKHVGAMLLMEASRQATIAVLEDEYCSTSEVNYGLILDRFDSQFNGYLFPLPCTLDTSIEELRSSSKNITVIVKTTVSQCGTVIANINLDVTLCITKVLDKIEARKAQGVVKDLEQSFAQSDAQQLNIA